MISGSGFIIVLFCYVRLDSETAFPTLQENEQEYTTQKTKIKPELLVGASGKGEGALEGSHEREKKIRRVKE